MSIPVLTAAASAAWETELAVNFADGRHGVTVVRRCVDLAELLSTAASGIARVALLSSELRGLDQDAITRLQAAKVVVLCIADPADSQALSRLQQIGVTDVLAADAGAEHIAVRIVQAVGGVPPAHLRRVMTDPTATLQDFSSHTPTTEHEPGAGKIVAIWGPTGSPGRTTVAVGLADEAARLGIDTLLVDADVYGGVIAALLGLLDESPGLAAACRQANNGVLDVVRLAGLALQVRPNFRVLTGIARADRWPELRPASVETVLEHACRLASLIVVDCGFSLEQDEEITFDTAAPRRNGVTFSVLETADLVLCVGAADPIGLQRLIRGLDEFRAALPSTDPQVVINSLRPIVVPGDPQREITRALARHAGINSATFLPRDNSATDLSLGFGRTLAEVAPTSALRQAIIELTTKVISTVKTPKNRMGPGNPPGGYHTPPDSPGPPPNPDPPGSVPPSPPPPNPSDPQQQSVWVVPGQPMPTRAPQQGAPVSTNGWVTPMPPEAHGYQSQPAETKQPFTEFDGRGQFPPPP